MKEPDNSGCVHVQWPSNNVPYGGILHAQKNEYSPKTENFLKVLLDESKMSMLQRQRVDWSLRDGNYPEVRGAAPLRRVPTIQYRPRTSKRRSHSAIRESGDYEIERWRPLQRTEDRDLLKTRLQDIMEFGREGRSDVARYRTHTAAPAKKQAVTLPTKEERMDELLGQIRERIDWLSEMEALGEASPHRDLIRDQVAQRVREIESLEIMMISSTSCKRSARSESAPSIVAARGSGTCRQKSQLGNSASEELIGKTSNIQRSTKNSRQIKSSLSVGSNERLRDESESRTFTASSSSRNPRRAIGRNRQVEEENIAALGELLSTKSFGILK